MTDYQKVKAVLHSKKAEIEERLRRTDKHVHHREEPLSPDFAEQASEMENFEVLVALDEEGKKELLKINAALQRVEDDKYDECSGCGTNINQKRLEAIPYTTYCLDCSEKAQA